MRPIDRTLISTLKKTSVIPLMWETWEYRPSDFDLEYCKTRGILVLGTNEGNPPCDMRDFIGWTSIKLLFELGFDGGRVLLVGDGNIPAKAIAKAMKKIGINVTLISNDKESDVRYDNFREYFLEQGKDYDIIILAEHRCHKLILGTNGCLDFEVIKFVNPNLKIGVICGNVNRNELKVSGLRFEPQTLAPVGFMSYQPYMLGSRPVLRLYAAGLKVGEVMARARLSGMTIREAAKHALDNSPAMDFDGNLSWI